MPKSETFLRDAVRPAKAKPVVNLTYSDGFRFGFGAFIAILLGILIVGGVAMATITLFHFN